MRRTGRVAWLALSLLVVSGVVVAQSRRHPSGASPWFDATNYGAVCNGTTDDRAALQSAINAANAVSSGARGGTVLIPKGTCKFAAPLDLKSMVGVRIVGQGGISASALLYTGSGSASAIQANGSIGVQLSDVAVYYQSAAFTGVLVDFSQGAQPGASVYPSVQRSYLGASGTNNSFTAAALVNFDSATSGSVRDSSLQGAYVGVRLRNSSVRAVNAITVEGTRFQDFRTAAIINAGTDCSIIGNYFGANPLMAAWDSTHPGAFPTMAPAYAVDAAMATTGLTFSRNYVGDGDGSAAAFDSRTNAISGLSFVGNTFGGLLYVGDLAGASFSGNTFNASTLTFTVGGNYDGVSMVFNALPGAVTLVNEPTGRINRWGNRGIGGTNTLSDGLVSVAGMTIGIGAAQSLNFQVNNQTELAFTGTVLQFAAVNAAASRTINVATAPAASNGRNLAINGGAGGAGDTLGGSLNLRGGAQGSGATTQPHGMLNLGDTNTSSVNLWVPSATKVGSAIASAGTIAPTGPVHHVTGTTTIATITPPTAQCSVTGWGCTVRLIYDAVAPWSAAGNIAVAGTPTTVGTWVDFFFDKGDSKWHPSRVQ